MANSWARCKEKGVTSVISIRDLTLSNKSWEQFYLFFHYWEKTTLYIKVCLFKQKDTWMNISVKSGGIGFFWSLTSAFLWSTTFVSGRYLLEDKLVDPISLSFIRFALGGGILFALGMLFFRKKLLSVSIGDLLKLGFLGFFGVVGMSVFLFYGQETTTAINSSMIMQINPVIILFAGIFIGEKVSGKQIAGIAISLLGCLFVLEIVSGKGFMYELSHITGDALVFVAALCWTIYSIFGKKLVKRVGGYSATTWAMLFGALELFLIRLILPLNYHLPENIFPWSVVIYLAVFPTAVAFFAWYEAMNKIELSLLNVMQYLTPVFTIILSWLFLGERFTEWKFLGLFLVLVGVALTVDRTKTAPEYIKTTKQD
jgi:drug/metabolite transporter (DMT)-like permease